MKYFFKAWFKYSKKGFTLVEILVVISIIAVLAGIFFANLRFFGKEVDLNNSTDEVINTLRSAQNKTTASEDASRWGVYFNTSTVSHQFVLFKGNSYATREVSSDVIHNLANTVEFYDINLWEGKEVVFERITGFASSTGSIGKISLRIKANPAKSRTIIIERSGKAGLE